MKRSTVKAVAKSLRAGTPLGTVHLMIFVPSRDRVGERIAAATWTRKTLRVLGNLFRGATAYPKGLGVWRNDEAGGKLIFDETTMTATTSE